MTPPRGCDGRTLADLLVATALSVVVGALVVAFQINGAAWHRADQRQVAPVRPVRDAMDRMASDIRLADQVQCCEGSLVLHQRREFDLYQVTYWLDGGSLWRSVKVNYGAVAASTQRVVSGIHSLSFQVEDGWVLVQVEAHSQGAKPATFRTTMKAAPRLGVMP